MARRSIVLLNLGGPDRPESVQPFLNNCSRTLQLLATKILRLPLAKFISTRRAPIAREIYEQLGQIAAITTYRGTGCALGTALMEQDPVTPIRYLLPCGIGTFQ